MPEYYQTAGHAIAAGVTLPIVDILAVALKFWTRRLQRQPLKADDWLLVPATVLTTGIGIVVTYGAAQRAIGWPLRIPSDYEGDPDSLATDQTILARKIQYAYLLMYPLALGSTKASLLFLYSRIFSISSQTRILLLTMVAIVFAWASALFFANLFQCRTNFWANWGTNNDIQTQCLKTGRILFAACLTDFFFNLLIITIPIPLIWQLSLSTKRKFTGLSIFLLWAITVITSLVRLIVVTGIVFSAQDTSASNRFVGITASIYWGMVGSSIDILVACLPTVQVLFRQRDWGPFGPTLDPSDKSAPHSGPRSRLSGRPVIRVDYTVDVECLDRDSHPILTAAEPWTHRHENVSENGSDGIELQENCSKGTTVGQRPAPP